MRIVAVLETMWGERPANPGKAPRVFRINPYNFTGRRLYRFIGPEHANNLYVTNCCKELVCNARQHGKPDVEWLKSNLLWLQPEVILICGEIARKTFQRTGFAQGKHIYLPHPAARMWTKEMLKETEIRIRRALATA
jgi:hypothetical protein